MNGRFESSCFDGGRKSRNVKSLHTKLRGLQFSHQQFI